MTTRRQRFDLFEMVVIAGFAALLASVATVHTRPPSPTNTPGQLTRHELVESPEVYLARFGPKYSTNEEEWMIRDFFQDRRGGVFVDVGAGHFRDHSNTYFLETSLGWSGVAVDAQAEYGADYVRSRPLTRFIAAFVSDRSDAAMTLHLPDTNRRLASGSKTAVEVWDRTSVPAAEVSEVIRQGQASWASSRIPPPVMPPQ